MVDKSEATSELIGYARVSTDEQSVSMQVEALKRFGVAEDSIYSECISGSKRDRPALKSALRALRSGDTFVVWKLDRIARSIAHLLEVVEELDKKDVTFRSLTEGIETETPGGRFFLHVIGAFAQLERDLIAERTKAGIANAKSKGVRFGADFKLKEEDLPKVFKMVYEQGKKRKEVAEFYNVSVQTISRRLKEYEKAQRAKHNH